MRRLKLWLVVAVALTAGILAVAAAALILWPQVALVSSPAALARVELPGFAGHITTVSVSSTAGHAVPVAPRNGELWPLAKLSGGERLTVGVTVHRPRWAAWLIGHTQRRTFSLTTPDARLVRTILQVPAGGAVKLTFDKPVTVVSVAGSSRRLARPLTVVPLTTSNRRDPSAGSTVVAAATRTWERLSSPQRVSWFSARSYAQVLTEPRPDDEIAPTARLTLTFSEPVAQVLGNVRPTVSPRTPGHWRRSDAYTLSFRPSGFGFALGERVSVSLPATVHVSGRPDPGGMTTVAWQVRQGSTLRLQQLLAELGYLPLTWRPSHSVPNSTAAQLAAAVSPPAGSFSWRSGTLHRLLGSFWQPGSSTVLVRGAVMAFQSDHGLASDGAAGPSTWRRLLLAAQHHEVDREPYDYITVSKSLPETLRVWRNGVLVYKSLANTGIAARPPASGTFPVYARYRSTTMSGTNADGTPYHDPGVPYVAYFNGGDAVHGFLRSSYGSPQSLGCVELPYSAARMVFGYDPIGTLVTVS